MKEVNGTFYHGDTCDDLIALLEQLRISRQRVKLTFGMPVAGMAWSPSLYSERGMIGRSTGTKKIPLLIKTRRSLGGEALFTECIMEVCESPGKKVLWQAARK